jgi:cold-inducible RNA-binding protein
MKNIFVGNMSFQTSENELREVFEAYGEVSRCQVITDRDTGRSRGFAFVEMSDDQEAASAMAALNGKEVGGRTLNVSEAKPKPERTMSRVTNREGRWDYQSSGRDYYRAAR